MPRWRPGEKEKELAKVNRKRVGRPPKDCRGNSVCPLHKNQIEFIKRALKPPPGVKKMYTIRRLAKRYKCSKDTVAKARDGLLDHYFERKGRTPVAQKPETLFKKKVLEWIEENLKNSYCFVIDQRALRGTPDLLCCINGAMVGIELKSSIKETHSSARFKLQLWYLNKIRSANGYGLIIYPENWKKMQNVLKKIHKGDSHDIIELQANQKRELQRGLEKIRES